MYGAKIGKITSPRIPAHATGQKKCFVFHYQLNGRDFPEPGTLSVYLQYEREDGKGKGYVNKFAVSGHQGNFWHRRAITINEMNRPYEVIVKFLVLLLESPLTGENAVSDLEADQEGKKNF